SPPPRLSLKSSTLKKQPIQSTICFQLSSPKAQQLDEPSLVDELSHPRGFRTCRRHKGHKEA
ncbi:hypothetical protein BDQ17DRAFT_1375965, partial [Cyathus striatus]